MDGDGSIQINHWKLKYLQYRIVIKLKHTFANENMLIKNNIGGHITFVKDFVNWVEKDCVKILHILKIKKNIHH